MKGFLYGQTEYNLLSNSIHLNDYIEEAKKNSFTFLSMTDKSLYGCYKFYKECISNNIKPIIGLEINYIDDDGSISVLLAYALNENGFKNLLKLSTFISTNEQQYGLDFIESYKTDIAFVMVYDSSILFRYLSNNEIDEINKKLKQLNNIFNYFYIGYSNTNFTNKYEYNEKLLQIAKNNNIKCLPLHNSRYLKKSDYIIYEALTAISGNLIKIKEYEDYSFNSNPVITKELEEFINLINLDIYNRRVYLPKYPKTNGTSASIFLRNLCLKGLNKRLRGRVTNNYQQRLEYELSIIDKMGYSDYFLIVWDFILYAKKKGILVGPGRGSGAGALVSYCLGITEIDPLKYDLLFERFLNPERISMPDIDTDFPDIYRDDVIAYVNELYGEKKVCNISAFNTFQTKSAIRDLGRIRKIDTSRLNEIIHLVEENPDYDALLEKLSDRPDLYEFLYIVKGINGLPRHISTHAAGIIIASIPLDDIIPLQEGINGLYQSQLEASDLEKIGLLKMDFLGIRNLTIIDEVMKNIPNFDMNTLRNIPLNDKKTYHLLQQADTLGIFQLESAGIRNVLLKLKPENFNDLVAVIALYRPGPMDNIDEFIARRHGKKFVYEHPSLEPILKSTYGIIVYQEQIMQIAQSFAGFSLGQADLLRRAISKKKESEMKSLEESFINGAIGKGHSLAVAKHIYEYFLKFNNYGFNKSHAVAYGLVSYQMAYLKANYFNIFISKILDNVIGSTKTMVGYINYAKAHNVAIYKPNINASSNRFEITKVGLFMPLQTIFSIGEETAKLIINERVTNGLFKDFKDFKARVKLSESNLEALIYAGAFDSFGTSKKQMIEAKDSLSEIYEKYLENRIIDNSEYNFSYLQEKEYNYLGFNITYDIFIKLNELNRKYNANYLHYRTGRCIGCFKNTKVLMSKKQEQMMVGSFYDSLDEIEFVIFPSDYKYLKAEINTSKLYLIDYMISIYEKTKKEQLTIKNVIEC